MLFGKPDATIAGLASDAVIALSIFIVPLTFVRLARKHQNLKFTKLLVLFTALLFACGFIQLLAIWGVWHPVPHSTGLFKGSSAITVVAMAVMICLLAMKVRTVATIQQLRAEVNEGTERLAEANRLFAESERRRRVALEAAQMGTWSLNGSAGELISDSRCKALFGFPAHAVVDLDSFLKVVSLEDRDWVARAVTDAIERDAEYDVQYRVIWPNDTEHWIHAKGRAHSEANEKFLQGVAIDVTERKRMELEARQLASIIENSEDAIFSESLDGFVTSWNRGAQRLFGYTADQIVGQPTSMLAVPGRVDEEAELLSRIKNGGRVEDWETVRSRKDGQPIEVSLSLSPLRDWKGTIIGASKIARDITERNRVLQALRASEERFRTLAEAVPDMLFVLGTDGSPTFLSARFQQYLGQRAGSQTDLWEQIIHPDDYPKPGPHNGTQLEAQFRLRDAEGGYRWFLCRSVLIFNADGKVEQWIGSCTDIDGQKRTEAALRYSNDELRQFAHVAAHDLQEPLRNVANAATLLQRFHSARLNDDARELVADCVEGARRMHAMVKDLLAYSRVVESWSPTHAQCNAAEIMMQAVTNLSTAITESQAKVNVSYLPVLPMEKTHVLQVFQNLVSNSIKYRRPDVPPVIKVSATRRPHDWVLEFADNGIGFNPEYSERIFGVFKRLHQRHEYPGNGIGLAICARIVAHYGGQIWADAEPGAGATFRFTVPAHGEKS